MPKIKPSGMCTYWATLEWSHFYRPNIIRCYLHDLYNREWIRSDFSAFVFSIPSYSLSVRTAFTVNNFNKSYAYSGSPNHLSNNFPKVNLSSLRTEVLKHSGDRPGADQACDLINSCFSKLLNSSNQYTKCKYPVFFICIKYTPCTSHDFLSRIRRFHRFSGSSVRLKF